MCEIFHRLSLASLWNLMAENAGFELVGQQAFVGFGGYLPFALTVVGGLHPVSAILLAGDSDSNYSLGVSKHGFEPACEAFVNQSSRLAIQSEQDFEQNGSERKSRN